MVADTQMTELGRVRETIHNKYDRKFAAYSTLYMGLSFVQTILEPLGSIGTIKDQLEGKI